MMDENKDILKRAPFIFIVDDIQKNLQVLGNTLNDEGYDIGMASNGKEALEYIKHDVPDLILLDVMMPLMDGFETCMKLKEDEKTKDVPVIFLTAKTETVDIVKGFRAGGVDYVTKPFRREELLARIKTHLELKFSRERLKELNRNLEKSNKEKERYLSIVNTDLERAQAYVESLLPPPLKNGNILTEWIFVPCLKLGGDSFGYHWIDDDNFAMYLLDACGHGVGSALHSVTVLNVLRFQTLSCPDFTNPTLVMKELNKVFQMNRYNDLFFTMWYGVFNRKTRNLRYGAAGHHPAFLIDDGASVSFLEANNLVIGGAPEYPYSHKETIIPENSSIYIFSDGTFDFRLKKGGVWSIEGLRDYIAGNSYDPDLKKLHSHLKTLKGGEHLDDDFSFMKIRLL